MKSQHLIARVVYNILVLRIAVKTLLVPQKKTKSEFKHLLVCKLILLIVTLIVVTQPAAAQGVAINSSHNTISSQEAIRKYSTAQKRLLAVNTAIFINQITQSHLDADSIQQVASRITGQPFLLPYTERIEGDNFSATAVLINNNKITAAKKLSRELKGEDQIRALINLATWYLHQPKTFPNDLDSAEHYIQAANSLSLTKRLKKWPEECLMIMAEIQYQRGNIDESRNFFWRVISAAKPGAETAIVAGALQQLSKTFDSRDTAKLRYLKRSIDIYHRLHLVENEIVLRWLIADYYMTNNPALTEDNFRQVLYMQRSSGFKHELFTQYLLTAVYTNNSNYPNALKAAYAGLENMKWSGFNEFEGGFYMRIGIVYAAVYKSELAIPWFKKGIENGSEETHFFWYKSFLYLTANLIFVDKLKECVKVIDSVVSKHPPRTTWEKVQILSSRGLCYDLMNKTSLADLSYREILNVVKNYNDTYGELPETYTDCALFYIKLKNTELARAFLNKINPNSLIDVAYKNKKYNILYKIDSLEGNFKAALEHHILFQQANDAEAAYDQQQKLSELTVKYETEKKDQNIKLLREQQRIQHSELQKSRLIRNLTIAGSCLLALLLAVVINRYNLKQRTNAQIASKNKSLQHLLTEKEWLLKEVHHRVKNNLHTVICLLESQARYLENDALAAIENSQHRIYAMSLIHQKLYQSDDIKTIDMATYIPELVQSLKDSFDTQGLIRFKLNIEPINLSLSHAVPLGLIINEAITNSIKHAFPNYRKGEISISMTDNGSRTILELADNGIGMQQVDHDTELESLGLRLINGLSEDIDADISFDVDNGTRITLSFKPDILNDPDSFLKSATTSEMLI